MAETSFNQNPRFERAYHFSRRQMMINNFLGGISWAVGSVVGLAILFAILGFIAAHVNIIPFIGNFIADIIHYLEINKGIH